MRTKAVLLASALGCALHLASPAAADDLRFGVETEPTSLDPHFFTYGPNSAATMHIFDSLVRKDARMGLMPGLAESWRPVDERTWEFKLRPGVTFHDGSPLVAEDVAFTIRRIPNVPNSPGLFTQFTGQIREVQVVDPLTVRFRTDGPYPLMPNQLTEVSIVSHRIGEAAKTEDYNSGQAAVGTGPYRFVEWRRGERLVLRRNDAAWDGQPTWDQVTFRFIGSAPTRMAAVIAGDVDVIDNPPTDEVTRLRADPRLAVSTQTSFRVVYLQTDVARDSTPMATTPDGRNPFRDRRVREAVSKSISREQIVERVMSGLAVPASQMLPPGLPGFNADLRPDPFEPETARRLLAEAGYPQGFEVVLATPNNRYVNDEKVAQAVAQMLARVGIRTRIEAMPAAVFFTRRTRGDFTFHMGGLGSGSGEASHALRAMVATPSREKGYGAFNPSGYSNPGIDAMIERAMATLDNGAREGILRQAVAEAMTDYANIPLHWEVSAWVSRASIAYEGRMDQYNVAMGARRR